MPKTDQTEDKGKCRCMACGERFRRLSTFDRHRVGPMTDRRCLDAQALEAKGFRKDSRGQWMQSSREWLARHAV